MSSSRRWSVSVVFSLGLNLLALCVLGDFWRVPPPGRARPNPPSRFAVYTPPPAPPKPPPPDAVPPTPYDPIANPPIVPAAPPLPDTPLTIPSAAPLPLAPMPVGALTPSPDAFTSQPEAAAPPPAVAAPSVQAATPSLTPERPVLTSQRADAPELAPKTSDPSSDNLTPPTLAPVSGSGDEPGTTAGNGGASDGDGAAGGGKAGTGEGGSGGRGTGGDGLGPFGIKTGGGGGGSRRVVYLLDVSLSMRSRITRARAELHAALTNLQQGDSFDIIAFSGRVQAFDSELVPVSDATIAQADYYLTTLSLRAGTNLEEGLTRALSIPQTNTVIVLTDGVPTEGETDTKKLARIIKTENKNDAKIYAIGLVGKDLNGDDNSFEATQLLYEITEQNGGDLHTYTVGVQTP